VEDLPEKKASNLLEADEIDADETDVFDIVSKIEK
jgi:hypothetical protein